MSTARREPDPGTPPIFGLPRLSFALGVLFGGGFLGYHFSSEYIIDAQVPTGWETTTVVFGITEVGGTETHLATDASDDAYRIIQHVYQHNETVFIYGPKGVRFESTVAQTTGPDNHPWMCRYVVGGDTGENETGQVLSREPAALEGAPASDVYRSIRCDRDGGTSYMVTQGTFYLRPTDVRLESTSPGTELNIDVDLYAVTRAPWEPAREVASKFSHFAWTTSTSAVIDGLHGVSKASWEEGSEVVGPPFDAETGIATFRDADKLRQIERSAWLGALIWAAAGGFLLSEVAALIGRLEARKIGRRHRLAVVAAGRQSDRRKLARLSRGSSRRRS